LFNGASRGKDGRGQKRSGKKREGRKVKEGRIVPF